MTASASKQVSPSTTRPCTPDELASLLSTLRRLRQQVDVAIGCVEIGAMVYDERYHDPDADHDISIGDFRILDTKRSSQ